MKAFAGSTKTQGTGNLHFHCLLWIHGVPPTVAEIDRILSDEEHGPKFTDQLIGYTTAVMEHSLPISPEIICVPSSARIPTDHCRCQNLLKCHLLDLAPKQLLLLVHISAAIIRSRLSK